MSRQQLLQPARRAAKRNLKIGICGEHGGEAESVKFCHALGMDYVSCSPYRVPIARLTSCNSPIWINKANPMANAANQRRDETEYYILISGKRPIGSG